MRYLPGLPDLEGSRLHPAYNRAGCRTPMQWDDAAERGLLDRPTRTELYLPIDPDPDRPTVAAQLRRPELHPAPRPRADRPPRKATPALGGRADTEVVHAGYPFAYVRGGSHLVVVNPRAERAGVEVSDAEGATVLFGRGVTIEGNDVTVDGFGYAVLALAGRAS